MPVGRSNQLIMWNFWTRIFPRALNCRAHGTTFGPCWTSRTEWFTGLTWPNHKFGLNSLSLFQDIFVNGGKKNCTARPSTYWDPEWTGPFNSSLAAIAGFGSERVPHDLQLSLLRPDPADPIAIPHDPTDDLQCFTGSVFQEAARNAMVAFLGKYNNPYRSTDLVPAGITKWRAFLDNTFNNQYSISMAEFDGDNPFNGTGVSPERTVAYNYYRGNASLGTYTVVNGVGRIKATGVNGATHGFEDRDIGTYCVQIVSSLYTGLWKLVQIDGPAVCWFEYTYSYPGTQQVALYNRHQYPLMRLAKDAEDFIDEVDAAGKPCLMWICPHQTHARLNYTETPVGESGGTFEQCYDGMVDPIQAGYFDGEMGAVSPTSPSPITSDMQLVWAYIMQTMASVDDFLGRLLDKLDAVWPDNYYLIFTSDQGIQYQEQNIAGRLNGTIKTAIWEGSRRSFCLIIGPGIEQTIVDRPTMHADLPATILDMLGDFNNHFHLTRDGVSLLRVIYSSHQAYGRLIPDYGDWKTQNGEGYLGPDGYKFMRVLISAKSASPTALSKLYDWRLPSQGGDYETAEYDAVAMGISAARHAKMDALKAARFDFTTESNPFHDGRILQ